MPYARITDLPQAQVEQYTHHQKEAFLKAFNRAYELYEHDESTAFAVAHHAAQQTGKKKENAGCTRTRSQRAILAACVR